MARIIGWGSALLCFIFGLIAIWIQPEVTTVAKTGYTCLIFGLLAAVCFFYWLCDED
jgi:hypothetical protein